MNSQKVIKYRFLSEPEAVIPAKAGIQSFQSVAEHLDSGFHRSDDFLDGFVIMRRTYRTLNDCEMQHNTEVGLFSRPSII